MAEGNGWTYTFTKNNPQTLYNWRVSSDGTIKESEGVAPPWPNISLIDIEQYVKISSDRAIHIARRNGANVYLKKYPNAVIGMRYYYSEYGPACLMHFEEPGKQCPIEIIIHSETGEVFYTDLTCNDRD